jgi:hypothetical protein
MLKVRSPSSNPLPQSTSRLALFSIPLLPSHRRMIVGRSLLGESRLRTTLEQYTNVRSYLNGSILVATLQPAFTILHTLTTSRAPSRITGLGWHGSSSKQKTDMLATQTAEGDLRVWSVPKTGHQDSPTIIRVLGRPELQPAGLCWFAWSKNGRIVQHVEG